MREGAERLGFKVGSGSYRLTEAELRMGPLWDWMTHPFTRTPPGIASAPAAFNSPGVGPSHAAAAAIFRVVPVNSSGSVAPSLRVGIFLRTVMTTVRFNMGGAR
jgi:hypothetical protein